MKLSKKMKIIDSGQTIASLQTAETTLNLSRNEKGEGREQLNRHCDGRFRVPIDLVVVFDWRHEDK
jgi:hypothetical protein